MRKLLSYARALLIPFGGMTHLDGLQAQLARFRCTCGEFPVEGRVDGEWGVRCCGHEWTYWAEFLAWREEQDAKAGA